MQKIANFKLHILALIVVVIARHHQFAASAHFE